MRRAWRAPPSRAARRRTSPGRRWRSTRGRRTGAGPVQPAFGRRQVDGQDRDPAIRRQAETGPRPPEHGDGCLASQPADPAQRLEGARIARVRRGRQQHDPSRAARQPVHGSRPLRRDRRQVGLVHHQQVPPDVRHSLQHHGLLHEVDRGDRQGQPVPRRGFRPCAPEQVAKRREIHDRRPQSEAIRELVSATARTIQPGTAREPGSSRCAHEGRRGSARPAPSFPTRLRRRSGGAGRRAPMRAPVRPGTPSGPVARLPLPAGRRQPRRTPGAPAAPAPTDAGRRESTAVRGGSAAGGRTAGAACE